MRYLMTLIAFAAIAAVMAVPAAAQGGTLYEQEGGTLDGYAPVDGSGYGTTPSTANFIYQYGGTSSWSAVFAYDPEVSPSYYWTDEEGEDSSIDVEADIEMYITMSLTDPLIYFHLGNIYEADSDDLTAIVQGSFTSNNGQHVGISFEGEGKAPEDFDLDTGRITNAMRGTVDVMQRDISAEAFDAEIQMSWGSGYQPPSSYSGASHSMGYTNTLFWLVADGQPGSYNLQYRIKLFPETHQADGNYNLDPVIVSAPVL